jgi:hypothetical protein
MAEDEATSFAIARYDAMCRAIAAAHAVDEIKAFRDKAAALQAYARMAGNYEAENRCAEMRLRAERRAGELLATMDKAKGGQPYQATGPAARPVETLRKPRHHQEPVPSRSRLRGAFGLVSDNGQSATQPSNNPPCFRYSMKNGSWPKGVTGAVASHST